MDVEDDDLLAAVVAAVCCSDSNINTVPLPSRITPCNRVLYVLLLFNLSIIHWPSSSSFTFEMFELDCDWEYERDE